jgi:hypothetical protein
MISDATVGAFLRGYRSSFDDFTGVAMAAHYHLPSVLTRADGSVHCLSNAESTRDVLAELIRTYFRQGARLWQYEDLCVVPIGSRSVLASVDWLMLDERRALLKRWRHSYNLIESPDGLRILAATFNVP